MFKHVVKDSVCIVEEVAKPCSYGAKSYPSSKELFDFVQKNPSVKQFQLGDTGQVFDATLAQPTIGTRITKANKIANGVDPKVTSSNGGKGGGGKKIPMAARIDGGNLVIAIGESAKAVLDKKEAKYTVFGDVPDGQIKTINTIAREIRAKNAEPLRALVAKPHAIAKLDTIELDLGEFDTIEAAQESAVGKVATEISKVKRFELFPKLTEMKITLVGSAFEELSNWVAKTA